MCRQKIKRICGVINLACSEVKWCHTGQSVLGERVVNTSRKLAWFDRLRPPVIQFANPGNSARDWACYFYPY